MVKTSELTGFALDWAVAKCNGLGGDYLARRKALPSLTSGPSTNWELGGPIIEREKIHWGIGGSSVYLASIYQDYKAPLKGPTPLIAAMRCFVARNLGDEIEIPEELDELFQK